MFYRYEFPVSDMAFTRNIWWNCTRLDPKPANSSSDTDPSKTQHFYPYSTGWPYGLTTAELYKVAMPGCPSNWTKPGDGPCFHAAPSRQLCHGAPCPKCGPSQGCSWSFPLGKGGFDLPDHIMNTQSISALDYNYYAIGTAWQKLLCTGTGALWSRCGCKVCPCRAPYNCQGPFPPSKSAPQPQIKSFDEHGILNAPMSVEAGEELFVRPRRKRHYERGVEDYTVRADSAPATKLGFEPWNTSLVGVDSALTRFEKNAALSKPGWNLRIQGEDQDRMDGVYGVGMLGQNGGVRCIGSAPAAGGSPGAPLAVTPGGFARFERLDFGNNRDDVGVLSAVSARVSGAGTLVFSLGNLHSAGGVLLASLSYNASALPNDPYRPGWALATMSSSQMRSLDADAAALSIGIRGPHDLYVQFWPANQTVHHGPAAASCDTSKCSVEGQVCEPSATGSITAGFICCGVTASGIGNWCPVMAVPCGPLNRTWPVGHTNNYGTACMNTTKAPGSVNSTVMSPMRLDYFVLHRKTALTLKHDDKATLKAEADLPPPSCNLLPKTDLDCHNVTRGGKGPKGHYAVWCDDLVQLPCSKDSSPPCDSCAAPHGCHALCLANSSAGVLNGTCTAWAYNHASELCYLKSLPDLPANGTYNHVTGRPVASSDTSGRLWNSTALSRKLKADDEACAVIDASSGSTTLPQAQASAREALGAGAACAQVNLGSRRFVLKQPLQITAADSHTLFVGAGAKL